MNFADMLGEYIFPADKKGWTLYDCRLNYLRTLSIDELRFFLATFDRESNFTPDRKAASLKQIRRVLEEKITIARDTLLEELGI